MHRLSSKAHFEQVCTMDVGTSRQQAGYNNLSALCIEYLRMYLRGWVTGKAGCMYVDMYIRTYVHNDLPRHPHIHIHDLPTPVHRGLYTYLHLYIHTLSSVHTYIHTLDPSYHVRTQPAKHSLAAPVSTYLPGSGRQTGMSILCSTAETGSENESGCTR